MPLSETAYVANLRGVGTLNQFRCFASVVDKSGTWHFVSRSSVGFLVHKQCLKLLVYCNVNFFPSFKCNDDDSDYDD